MRVTLRRIAILSTDEAKKVMVTESPKLNGICTFSMLRTKGAQADGYMLEGFGGASFTFYPSEKGVTWNRIQIVSTTKNEALVLARIAREVGLLKFDAFPTVLSAIGDAVETGAKHGIQLHLDTRLVCALDKIRESTGESRNAIISRFVANGVEQAYSKE